MTTPDAELARIAVIPDLPERVRAASALAREQTDLADAARPLRDDAALVALRDGKARQQDLLEPLGISRRRIAAVKKSWAKAGRTLPEMDDPIAVAREHAAVVLYHAGVAEAAVEVRNEAMRGLSAMRTAEGKPVHRPADLSRLSGLTTARITQLGLLAPAP